MALTFKEWLKLKFDKLMAVQGTAIQSQYADLVVHFWSGHRIHIHLINQIPTIRNIKRILHDNTQVGVNTLLLVDAKIMPQDNQRINYHDWLQVIHTLNDERIYVYRVENGEAEIFQIHLEPVLNSGDVKVWYGPKIQFDGLRHARRSYKLRSIKGDWLIADFGAPAFWQNIDFRAARAQRDRAKQSAHWTHWSTFETRYSTEYTDAHQKDAQSTRRVNAIGDYLTTCYQLLEVEKSATQEEVKKAFRKQALLYHPDTSTLPTEEADQLFKQLSAAYEYIKASKGW
jgi:hypothetical protein